jgi:hypothetical protein
MGEILFFHQVVGHILGAAVARDRQLMAESLGLLFGVGATIAIDAVAVPVALAWRWRCKTDGAVFAGSELRIADPRRRGALLALKASNLEEVERGDLRHACGSRNVIPVAPIVGGSLGKEQEES